MKTKSMQVINNQLYIGKYSCSLLAQEYKTPLYIYDELHIREKLETFQKNFQSKKYECMVVYATKAFFAPYLGKIIDEYDMGLDSVSLGDLYMINKSGFPMEKVVLHGNNKTIETLEYAIDNNVGYIVVDNSDEVDLLLQICKKKKKNVYILLRLNLGISAHTHQYIQTSLLSSKFGESAYDQKKVLKIIKKCQSSKYIDFKGFHAHIGSNIHQAKSFQLATSELIKFLVECEKKLQTSFEILNFGGGFGIKYLDSDKELNLEKCLKQIIKIVDKAVDEYSLNIKKIMLEPGRSIVGDSGFTLYTVGNYKKTYGGKNYVFVDGGMTDNIRPALYQAKYSVDICNHVENETKEKVDVVGPCCESGDIVVQDYYLGKVNKGDVLVVYSTGAYGYSMASNYNGALKAEVLFINDDRITRALKRESYDDLCHNFIYQPKIFDVHSDMLYDLWINKTKNINNRFEDYHLPQLKKSLVKAMVFTMYSPNEFDLIEACKIAIKEIPFSKIKNMEIILGLEGLRNLKSIEEIDILYDLGFRHAMVTWNEENQYATGAKANPKRGLTAEGIKLYQRMEHLDMIIDLAHLNEKSFFEALEVVHKNIIYSHGNIKALCNHPRNVTDQQMLALKKVDGLLGLTLANSFIAEDKESQTLEKFLEHVKYAINIMGINNVCFGFDFMDYLTDFPNSNLEAINDTTKTYRLITGLKEIGLSDEDINKICYENFYSRFKNKLYKEGK